MATVQFWAVERNIKVYVQNHVDKIGLAKFSSKKEKLLGDKLEATGFEIESLVNDYWKYCKQDPALKSIIETATYSQKQDNIETTKKFISNYVREFLGSIVKNRK